MENTRRFTTEEGPMSLSHRYPYKKKLKRVVVIGKSGFVGGAIIRKLESLGVPCLGIGRTDIDLLKPKAGQELSALLRPTDSVVATSAIAPCKSVAMLADNMIIARNILDALSRVRVAHIVNVSSDAVYPDQPVPLTEEVPPSPTTIHGVMHFAREIAFQAEGNAPLAILRPSLLYGVNDPHNGYGPNRFLRLARNGDPIVLFGEGEERRDHVLINDMAEIAYRVLLHESTGVLNVATGVVASFADIAKQIIDIAASTSIIHSSTRIGPVPHNGYRPFDISACKIAFPDFVFRGLSEGLLIVKKQG